MEADQAAETVATVTAMVAAEVVALGWAMESAVVAKKVDWAMSSETVAEELTMVLSRTKTNPRNDPLASKQAWNSRTRT